MRRPDCQNRNAVRRDSWSRAVHRLRWEVFSIVRRREEDPSNVLIVKGKVFLDKAAFVVVASGPCWRVIVNVKGYVIDNHSSFGEP
jgi:hypothetical protein